MQNDLFHRPDEPQRIDQHTLYIPQGVLPHAEPLLQVVAEVFRVAPRRRWQTPTGQRMAVASSNMGDWGWMSDECGYRYSRTDPNADLPWPAMPQWIQNLVSALAAQAGFAHFVPNACLINHYRVGTGMGLHRDWNEGDTLEPIVSFSLGMSARLSWGGLQYEDPVRHLWLHHGDVWVWGGADRLRYHAIAPLEGPAHPRLGAHRLNLTFRRVGD